MVTARGGRVVTRRAVRRIERTATAWRVIHGPTTDEQALDADAVVIAVPAAPAARLLQPHVRAAAVRLGEIDAASVAIVTTAWRRADAPRLASSGYLVPAVYRRPVKAVTFSSAKWAHLDLGEFVVVRCSIGRHGDVTELQRDDADLVSSVVEELTAYAGFIGMPVESRVSRWGGGLPQYTVGHLDRVAAIRSAVAAVPGLAVCGASYDGVGVPACIATGEAAAAQILAGVTTL
jgi:oxygen-dependent protoporphyrinogen oxidase